MNTRTAAIAFRLAFAALALTAVGVQFFAVTIAQGHSILNFFSYFTNLSNIMISIVFIVSALRLLPGRKDPSDSDVAIRGGAVVYIAFVGIVFNTILADVALGPLIPWVNVVLHMIVPIAGVVDWLLWAPRRRLPFRVVPWWMIWPAVYSVYSVTRGAIDGFYPYPFFNPEASGGYGGVALWCLVLILAFFILAVLVRWAGNLRHRSLTSPAAQSDGLPERAPRG